jgi:segregation and condensation protein B
MTLDLGQLGDASELSVSSDLQVGPDVPLAARLEAVLMVAEEPLAVEVLAEGLDAEPDEIATTLRTLADEYAAAGRGFALRDVAEGWRFYTAAECAPYVERFVLSGQTARLSQAALETLAIVAYQQPVTRGRIAAVRGVNVDGVVRTLLTRKLIAEAGPDAEGGALTYRTTGYFLERMGLRDLSELPPLAPLLPGNDELAELMDPVPVMVDRIEIPTPDSTSPDTTTPDLMNQAEPQEPRNDG